MFLWIKQDWSFSQWDLNYSKLINLLVLIDNRKNCVKELLLLEENFSAKSYSWTIEHVFISIFLAFFPRKSWLLIITPEGIIFQNPQTLTSQTWTTSHDVTKMSTHITKTVFQARKKEWVLQLQQILNLVFKNNVKFYAYGSRAIKVKTRIFKVIMT